MTAQHTPGPMASYTLNISADSGYESSTEGRCTAHQYGIAIAALHGETTTSLDLIAAAPKLLEAAQQAERWIAQQMVDIGWPQERIDSPPSGSHLFNLRSAIAKATGDHP